MSKIPIFPILLLGIISILLPNVMAQFTPTPDPAPTPQPQQQNCGAMGMRTNEQGQCEDINMFGPTPIPTPRIVEEGIIVDEPDMRLCQSTKRVQ